ncbi:O-antigen ligase family protein [Arthrobacter sp. USHLN218]|uniref:O-antigen ligase family protein n=1 Tax=Arthrobacter sp. USHLN218 TaxID=3081232 RepID=UPI00301A0D67
MSSIVIIACVGVLLSTRNRGKKILLLVGLVNVGGLYSTGSLSSIITLVVGLTVVLVCQRATLKFVAGLIAATCISSVIFILSDRNPFAFLSNLTYRLDVVTGKVDEGVASLNIRFMAYEYAWATIKSAPFLGVGMGPESQGTYNGVSIVHNYLLRAWFQGGILLLLVMLLVTLLVVRRLLYAIRHRQSGIAAGISVAILTFALTSAFYNQQQYWLILLFGLVFSHAGDDRRSADRTLGSQPRKGVAA